MKMPERVDASAFAEAMSGAVGEARTETRGRKKKAQASEDVRAMDLAVQKQHENEKTVAEIDKAYLPEGESYNLHIAMERARFYQAQAASSYGKSYMRTTMQAGFRSKIIIMRTVRSTKRSTTRIRTAAKSTRLRLSTGRARYKSAVTSVTAVTACSTKSRRATPKEKRSPVKSINTTPPAISHGFLRMQSQKNSARRLPNSSVCRN